jgi:hypothetical protein
MIEYIILHADGTVMQRSRARKDDPLPQVAGKTTLVVAADDPRYPPGAPAPTYADYRHMDYPPIGDQLDAIWKMFSSLGAVMPPDVAAVRDRVQSVKQKHPKQ